MDISMRAIVTAGVSAVAASAIVAAPSLIPLPQETVTVTSAAQVRPLLDPAKVVTTSVVPQALVGGAADVGTLSAGSNVMDIYNAIEPWVQYGFEVATWAVGWIPVVGIFSGQIMVGYFTVEPLVRSAVQSFAFLLDGNIGAIPGELVNGVVSAASAFVQQEINWVLGFFPPFPPFPPLPFAASATAFASPMAVPTALGGPIGNVVVDASHALASVAQAIGNTQTIQGPGLIPATGNAFATTVNSIGARGGQAIDARAERRAARAEALADAPGAVAKGVVRAQGEVRSLVKATVDAVTTAGAGRTDRIAPTGITGFSKAPSSAAKGLDGAAEKAIKSITKAVSDVRKDVRKAVKAPSGNAEH